MNYILPILLIVMFLTMVVFTAGGSFIRYFNLVDKRGLMSDESYQKVAKLSAFGDFSLHSSVWFNEKRYNRISLSYEKSKNETVSKSFMGEDLNQMVNEAFDWASNEGYLK